MAARRMVTYGWGAAGSAVFGSAWKATVVPAPMFELLDAPLAVAAGVGHTAILHKGTTPCIPMLLLLLSHSTFQQR